MTGNLSVLIADDHPVFRSGLTALLATDHDVEVIGEADNGRTAIQADLVDGTHLDQAGHRRARGHCRGRVFVRARQR